MHNLTESQIPKPILDLLVNELAVAAAHHQLCEPITLSTDEASTKPKNAFYEQLNARWNEVNNGPRPDTPIALHHAHPGDQFGETLWWLWNEGHLELTVSLVGTYLLEMRTRNPHHPEAGDRPTWNKVRKRLHCSLPDVAKENEEEVEKMLTHIEDKLPYFCGMSIKKLNED